MCDVVDEFRERNAGSTRRKESFASDFHVEKRLPFCNRTKIGMTTTPCVNSTKSRRNVTGEPFNHFVFACSYDDVIIKVKLWCNRRKR
ncbi:Uncharacterized protein APZ42_016170 [Daphnia magna]|uniref:Uncharacterized protein n=1 Tax=Daphnia magna TaxID=35525 RepID=A0A162NN47_9CRUS|nr:Uncharacterized protein APZ42_016170 [Daphnia magna]